MRVLERKLEADAAAHGIAEHVGLLDAEAVQDRRHVAAHGVELDRPIAELRAAMAVEVYADHPPLLGEHRQDRREHAGGAEAAMKEEQRLAGAVDLVVVADATGFDVAGLDARGRGSSLAHGGLLGMGGRGENERRGSGIKGAQHRTFHRKSPAMTLAGRLPGR